jgi:uncharacterized membrane protein YhaH (DUF805 family)
MSWWVWLLIILGSLILIIVAIKLATKVGEEDDNQYSSNSGNFFNKVKDVCCALLNR